MDEQKVNAAEQQTTHEAYDTDVMPISESERTLGTPSNFAIWFACNLVATTMLTGMLMIPDLSVGGAIKVIFLGSVIGVCALVAVGIIGQRTGLVTMVALRATFGLKGSILPSAVNILILIAWSWAQAAMGGLAIDYAVQTLTGFSNPNLFTILTEILVVVIALYAIKGISLYEKIAMVLIVVISGVIIFKAVTVTGMGNVLSVLVQDRTGLTAIAAFDVVVATALSWTPMAADYNRNCKTRRGVIIGSGVGYALGTTLSMGVGALLVGMIIAAGQTPVYEASHVFASAGFGIAGSVVIFLSVVAANVMCVYSSAMSFLNIFPKPGFKKTAITIGVICVVGALFSGILDVFFSFVTLIGVLFMPIFALMITDFFFLHKRKYNIDAIVYPEKDHTYRYQNGVNAVAMVVYVISAFLAYYWSYISPLPTGATIPSFIVASVLYYIAMKLVYRKKSLQEGGKDNAESEKVC